MNLRSWKLVMFLAGVPLTGASAGGISFDGSMGPAGTLNGPTYLIPAGMGTQVGGNLFHSFSQFNLLNGETANFTATGSTAPISNIIARVTGGSPSSIDGTIQSSIAGANLFLLNPSGVMFGPHAQVNITGSFTTGTPDFIKMSDGVGLFNTSLGGNDVLTSASVSAFGFLARNTQPMAQFSQSHLTFTTGSNVAVIGGDILLDGATLSAPAGNVTFFSAMSGGGVAFDPTHPATGFGTPTVTSFGNVTLQHGATVAIGSAQSGGGVLIRGGRLTVENASAITSTNSGNNTGGGISIIGDSLALTDSSTIAANTQAGGAAGRVSIQAESVSITNGASVTADTFSSGGAGEVAINGGALSIDASGTSSGLTGISASCNQGATSAALGGLVTIDVTGALSLRGGGVISSSSFSAGSAGQIDIQAGSLTLNGLVDGSSTVARATQIASDCDSRSTGNGGGNISLIVNGAIEILNAGAIDTDTASSGQAGNITIVQADSLDINGAQAVTQFTGISSDSLPGATGNGGTLSVTVTNSISMEANGVIEANTDSSAAAGNISVHAASMTIDGSLDPNALTGIASNANSSSSNDGGDVVVNLTYNLFCTGAGGIDSQTFSSGHGGKVDVTAGGNISMTDGGYIDADAYSSGNGGTLSVTAQSIVIAGPSPEGDSFPTGIDSDSSAFFRATAIGNGGSVTVTAGNALTMLNGGTISASTETLGNGGDVLVNVAGYAGLSMGAQIMASSSGAGTMARTAGTAGNVTLNAGTLALNDRAAIATSAINADAGSIDITATRVSLKNASSLTTSAGANGGNVTLHVDSLFYMLNSSITATAGTLKLVGAFGVGGNIAIDPQFVVLDGSLISANAALGKGGNISIITNDFLNDDSLLTATGSTNGTITISSPDLDLSGSLVALPIGLVDNANRLRESCARSINHEFSTFIVVGRGGTESAPEEFQPDFGFAPAP